MCFSYDVIPKDGWQLQLLSNYDYLRHAASPLLLYEQNLSTHSYQSKKKFSCPNKCQGFVIRKYQKTHNFMLLKE